MVSYPNSVKEAGSYPLTLEEFATEQIAKRSATVAVNLTEKDLRTRETKIYRTARSALMEGGVGISYIAFGFLERSKNSRLYRAPLILAPVSLERKSVKDGVSIVATDDSPDINKTLLELLRSDYELRLDELQDELPSTGDDILDVCKIWDIFRQAVDHLPECNLSEEIVLANFSFTKYLMWADLKHQSSTLEQSNGVVAHLMNTPNERYNPNPIQKPTATATLDEDYAPHELMMPLDADSSQIAAVASANNKNDFIIIGPPGTGKSQTISNMIAHLIGQGKSVLFVAEKAVALDVVHKRLSNLGLGNFCLKLHSHDAKKKLVLQQLNQAASTSSELSPATWEYKSQELKDKRDQLNRFIKALHKRQANGFTTYEGIGYQLQFAPYFQIKLDWPYPYARSGDDLTRLRAIAKELTSVADSAGRRCHFAHLVGSTAWSFSWEEQIKELATSLSAAATECADKADSLGVHLGLTECSKVFKHVALTQFAHLASLCETNSAEDIVCIALANVAYGDNFVQTAIKDVASYQANESKLSTTYPDFKWKNLDLQALEQQASEASNAWFLPKMLKTRKLAQQLQPACQGKPKPLADIRILQTMFQLDQLIAEHTKKLAYLRVWQEHKTDCRQIIDFATSANEVLACLQNFVTTSRARYDVCRAIATAKQNSNGQFEADCRAFIEAYQKLTSATEAFKAVAQADPLVLYADYEGGVRQIASLAFSLATTNGVLQDICRWNTVKQAATQVGLGELVTVVANGHIPAEAVCATFEAAYWRWWTTSMIDEDQVLQSFSSEIHKRTIEQFRQLDSEYQALTAQCIASRISANIVRATTEPNSGWGELRRYMAQTRPRITVRELTEKFPDLLTVIAPCWMMSPLSVSQYLSATKQFDVVILDEASQITTWDAIGTLARGKQVIVAGDPKQMPPSNFFQRQTDVDDVEDEAEENLKDLESILDEMETAQIPKQYLNLHYRSQKEDLIAFSNHRYYENQLITFPSPGNSKGVSYVSSQGAFSGNRTNLPEARLIVNEIVARLQHADVNVRQQTIGVVTFNQPQQQLIETLLDQQCTVNPALESAFSDEAEEPIFVKNLENVQGDERDVILFSVGYGPNEAGNPPAMRFGPLNFAGGERRLNVAITRARYEMKIFSSLHPDQMRIRPGSPQGVIDLKDFLQFAINGAFSSVKPIGGTESPFEWEVARELQKRKWEVVTQVGVSRYRIDIAIVHPDKPGAYLAGIECDGATYHSTPTAKERDKIRQRSLEKLGWTIFRVWSRDWWYAKDKAADVLHQQLLQAWQADKASASIALRNEHDRAKQPLSMAQPQQIQ